jgi:hypothetical protein
MAITSTEKPESRSYTEGESAELLYTILGTADETAARDELKSTSPLTFNSLDRQPVLVEPSYIDEDNPDNCIWNGIVEYAPFTPLTTPATGESTFQFDTGGGTQHITQSLETTDSAGKTGAADPPPDYHKAIGVTEDSVEGVDIALPVYNWSETHYLSTETVTNSYKGDLFRATATYNESSFKGFEPGECLFLGASGSQRSEGDWEINFRFASLPNKTVDDIEGLDSVNKLGWEYVWVRYEDEEDTTANALVKRPVAVYVERVYEASDFGLLGIGET